MERVGVSERRTRAFIAQPQNSGSGRLAEEPNLEILRLVRSAPNPSEFHPKRTKRECLASRTVKTAFVFQFRTKTDEMKNWDIGPWR